MAFTLERIRQLLNRAQRRILSKATRETRKGNINHPCAKLVSYLQEKISLDNEERIVISISNFIDEELPFLVIETQAVPLITYFLIRDETLRKKYGKQVTKKLRKAKNDTRLKQKQVKKLSKLIEMIIWTSEARIWDVNKLLQLAPSRNIREGIGKSGTFFSEKLSREVAFESQLEYKFLQLLESLDNVIYYLEQPFSMEYAYKNKTRKYYPDIFFLLNDGRGIVVEVKPVFQMGLQINLEKWNALKAYCYEKGLGIIVTDGHKSIQDLQNHPIRKIVKDTILSNGEMNSDI